jgi:hypothetical protein
MHSNTSSLFQKHGTRIGPMNVGLFLFVGYCSIHYSLSARVYLYSVRSYVISEVFSRNTLFTSALSNLNIIKEIEELLKFGNVASGLIVYDCFRTKYMIFTQCDVEPHVT